MINNPTVDPTGGTEPLTAAPVTSLDDAKTLEIVTALTGYYNEADNNRKGGPNPRDEKWRQNTDLYWGRRDFSRKATWQSRAVMAEVPAYVDRFAAALKESLIASPGGFYTVADPADKENDLAQSVKRITDVWLSRTGRNQVGSILAFPAVFEEQMKLGALMSTAAAVIWKGDTAHGRVAIEAIDPRFVWLDHTFRNLYRIRRIELDRHDLAAMAKEKDGRGRPIYNLPEVEKLVGSLNSQDQAYRQEVAGHGMQVSTGRSPVTLDEYIATVVDSQGEVIADRALMVVANNRYLIRGPEKNPFWHGQDWMVYAPLVTAPLSVYGRSYMEDFGAAADTFNELTNMILDAVYTSSLKAFAVVPGMLLNPNQLAGGITPNKLFHLEEGYKAEDFMKAIDLGNLTADSVKVWEAMKNELSEAANMNEIGIGQFAPKGRTSATEVNQTQQSSSALIRSIAQTVETRWLDPVLDRVWKTGLQHASPNDPMLKAAAGEEMYRALIGRRRELISRPITFQARGISQLIRRSDTLKSLLGLMQVISSNEILAQEFLKVVDLEKLAVKLFELSGIDITSFQLSERDKAIRSVTEPLQGAQAAAQEQGGPAPGNAGAPPTANAEHMAGLAKTLGVLQQNDQSGQMAAIDTLQGHTSHIQNTHHTHHAHAQKLRHADEAHALKLAHTEAMHQVKLKTAAQPKPTASETKGDD